MEAVERTGFTRQQIELIKNTVARGATDDELALFLYQAQRTGLDPLAGQIHFIKRGGVGTIQTGIDGFRVIAERSGKYAGQVGPYWCGPDGEWKDVWLSSEPPAAAKVGVLRTDFAEPVWGVARYDAYCQRTQTGPQVMWAKMGDVMIAKVAEALAIRKAFPLDLSGLYVHEEMQQADTTADTEPPAPAKRPQPQLETTKRDQVMQALADWALAADVSPDYAVGVATRILCEGYKVGSLDEITKAQWAAIHRQTQHLIDRVQATTTNTEEAYDPSEDPEVL
ncbi:MAG: phage recombination protein Bet [Armatimonadia bacterium]